MALRQGKYSELGKALGQYRTSLYDVMEKEHDKEFLAWKGEKDRAEMEGTFGAVAQGLDMWVKMKDKKRRADETKAYIESESDSVVERTKGAFGYSEGKGGLLGKMQKGLEDVFGGAKYTVSPEEGYEEPFEGNFAPEGEYTAGQLRGMSQFHQVESYMNPSTSPAKEKPPRPKVGDVDLGDNYYDYEDVLDKFSDEHILQGEKASSWSSHEQEYQRDIYGKPTGIPFLEPTWGG